MNTTNINTLKQFYSVVNRKNLNREIYELLLARYDLDKVDLDDEILKIENKKSNLPRSKREAIPEFLILRQIVQDMEQKYENDKIQSIDFNNENDSSVMISNIDYNEIINNPYQVQAEQEIH